MVDLVIAHDLGTGGNKASLYDVQGNCLAEEVVAYPTTYPEKGWHEQRPRDWWRAIVEGTQGLLKKTRAQSDDVKGLGVSGHSLGVVPLDAHGALLREATPIWSDSRAEAQAHGFFERVPERDWYAQTGNGFPAPLYSVFKMMWYREHEPQMFSRIHRVVGTKDYVNFRLTGRVATDHSYASGSGVYDLVRRQYATKLLEASQLPAEIFPEIVASSAVLGPLSQSAATELGLGQHVQVVAGGVDNSCMALGAGCTRHGRMYTSQGSSSWLAVTTKDPVIDQQFRPFVFSAVVPGLFNSAIPVFSSGSSLRWVRDQLCPDLLERARRDNVDVYDLITALAAESPVGARGVLFNPTLAGGSSLHDSSNIRGALLGLDLGHSRSDVLRAVLEGIALEMRVGLDKLREGVKLGTELLVVGGGGRSQLWRQIYADVFGMTIVKTNVDQQAAALGAAALAWVGLGAWRDFEPVQRAHQVVDRTDPIPENRATYDQLVPIFVAATEQLSILGDRLASIRTARLTE